MREYQNYRSALAYYDPTHKHYLTENSFEIFFHDFPHNKNYTTARFQLMRKTKEREGHRILPRFLFPFEKIRLELKVVK